MLQRQNKNNDLVIQVEGAGISKIEYYTDGLYKYMVDYAPTVYIPSSELQKMNDGQLRSTVYLSTPDNNFDDGTKDMTIDQTFNIWIGSEKAGTNNYYTKDEVDQLIQSVDLSDYYTKDEVDKKITAGGTFDGSQYYTKKEIDGKFDNIVTEIPEEYITESELNQKGYLTEYQSLAEYALKSEIPDITGLATKSEIPDVSNLATKTELNTAIGNIDTILDNINGQVV